MLELRSVVGDASAISGVGRLSVEIIDLRSWDAKVAMSSAAARCGIRASMEAVTDLTVRVPPKARALVDLRKICFPVSL
jgi:hypothetical protein